MLKKKQEDGNLGLGQDGQSGSTLQGECRMGNALFSGAIKPEVEFWGTLHCSQANDFRSKPRLGSMGPLCGEVAFASVECLAYTFSENKQTNKWCHQLP